MPRLAPPAKPKRARTTPATPGRALGRSLADFGQLSPAEKKLLDCCRRGVDAVIGRARPRKETPGNVVRAAFVRFLALGGDETAPVHEYGVSLKGAWLTGVLDFSSARLDHELALLSCRIERIIAWRSTIKALMLDGSRLENGLGGEGLRCAGPIYMGDGFRATGGVILWGAAVGGDLDCRNATFDNGKDLSLAFAYASISGTVSLNDGFRAIGEVNFQGAKIGGNLVCSASRFKAGHESALVFERATVAGSVFLRKGFHAKGEVRLLGATIGGILDCDEGRFDNGRGTALDCESARIGGLASLAKGFHATGEVNLYGSTIGGSLNCRGRFECPDGTALSCSAAAISGGVYLGGGFHALGQVYLMGATIGGDLICSGGRFENPGRTALFCDDATIALSVFLGEGFRASGATRFLGARIGRHFQAWSAQFEFTETWSGFLRTDDPMVEMAAENALALDRASISGNVLLQRDFKSTGTVSLFGATIGGTLQCEGNFDGGHEQALVMTLATVSGNVRLRQPFQATGEVSISGATIRGDLDCTGGNFRNEHGPALFLDRAAVSGSIMLSGEFHAVGQVSLFGATVGGNLVCNGGRFEGDYGLALNFGSASIAADVYLNGDFHATRDVRLANASIGRSLYCNGGSFESPGGTALACALAQVGGALYFCNVNAIAGTVDLSGARIQTLHDDAGSWAKARGEVVLDGFTYERIAGKALDDAEERSAGRDPHNAKDRIDWLDGQLPAHLHAEFRPQPWEQLIAVLRAMGHPNEARAVAIAKQNHLRWAGKVILGARTLHWLYGLFAGYGYRPIRLLVAIPVVWLLCAIAYDMATDPIRLNGSPPLLARAEGPQNKRHDFSTFEPWAYSADVLLPIVDFGYQRQWEPVVASPDGLPLVWGRRLRWLYWFEIAFGWVAGLLLAGVAGNLIKKD